MRCQAGVETARCVFLFAHPEGFGEGGELLGRNAQQTEDGAGSRGRSMGRVGSGVAQGLARGVQHPRQQFVVPENLVGIDRVTARIEVRNMNITAAIGAGAPRLPTFLSEHPALRCTPAFFRAA
jgi:hypothetical protein